MGESTRRRTPAVSGTKALDVDAHESGSRSTTFWRPADPRLEDLVGMLAHDLRGPLDAVLGWAELLRSGTPSGEDIRNGLEVICRKSRIQAALISDLLDLWELRSGRASLVRRSVCVDALLRHAIQSSHTTGHPDVTLDVEPSDHAFVVLADRDRLTQALERALAVSATSTPAGGVLSVLLQAMPSSIRIEFVVRHPSDSGLETGEKRGLAPRVNGIPLMLVRQIVEQHGGSLELECESGRPSIEISLPTLVDSAQADASVETPTPTPVHLPHLAGLRVLVVDDDSDARDMCMAALVRHGACVTTAGSTSEALAIVNSTELDVLVTDIMMPGEDGYALLQHIRASPSTAVAHMPAAALTACSRSEDRWRVVNAGFQLHLTKPIDPPALAEAIGALWSDYGPRQMRPHSHR